MKLECRDRIREMESVTVPTFGESDLPQARAFWLRNQVSYGERSYPESRSVKNPGETCASNWLRSHHVVQTITASVIGCPSLLSHKPLGSHTLWLLFSLKATNYTSLRLGTGGGWGQERTQCNFPRIHAPKSGSVTAPARLIVSGRESDEHKNTTTQKGTGNHTKAFGQLPGKLCPAAASNNPGTVQLSAGEGEIIICKNVTNISLCYLT